MSIMTPKEETIMDKLLNLLEANNIDELEKKALLRKAANSLAKEEKKEKKERISIEVLERHKEEISRLVNYLYRMCEKCDTTGFSHIKIGTHTFSLRLFSKDTRKNVCSKATLHFVAVEKTAKYGTYIGPCDRKTMQDRLFKHLSLIVHEFSRLKITSEIVIYRESKPQVFHGR